MLMLILLGARRSIRSLVQSRLVLIMNRVARRKFRKVSILLLVLVVILLVIWKHRLWVRILMFLTFSLLLLLLLRSWLRPRRTVRRNGSVRKMVVIILKLLLLRLGVLIILRFMVNCRFRRRGLPVPSFRLIFLAGLTSRSRPFQRNRGGFVRTLRLIVLVRLVIRLPIKRFRRTVLRKRLLKLMSFQRRILLVSMFLNRLRKRVLARGKWSFGLLLMFLAFIFLILIRWRKTVFGKMRLNLRKRIRSVSFPFLILIILVRRIVIGSRLSWFRRWWTLFLKIRTYWRPFLLMRFIILTLILLNRRLARVMMVRS